MSKAAADVTKPRDGTIVNISPPAGNLQGSPVDRQCAAKVGAVGMTRGFPTACGPVGIRTNAVCPRAVDTPRLRAILDKRPDPENIHNRRNPSRRMPKAEIASMALFPASAYVNGHATVADGGYTLQI